MERNICIMTASLGSLNFHNPRKRNCLSWSWLNYRDSTSASWTSFMISPSFYQGVVTYHLTDQLQKDDLEQGLASSDFALSIRHRWFKFAFCSSIAAIEYLFRNFKLLGPINESQQSSLLYAFRIYTHGIQFNPSSSDTRLKSSQKFGQGLYWDHSRNIIHTKLLKLWSLGSQSPWDNAQ